ncbi:HET-domain-containing protein [Hyaloscypha variabilis F]|uniref:HET-domain-containing protein n=1 Tax=Hyaloscypha variabilis (strain UAMH 11265 / GT02V1 / F) TaxID=1149755 RepID=A0A2J6RZ41_HYAVF|nr:HET-domain-containing protein [Hyaloscypha variabilis F]
MATRSILDLYSPLHENEIRYLALLPGKFSDPIDCRLIQGRDLPADVTYEALSYQWGPNSPEYSIAVNGVRTKIRVNLRNALRRLRKKGEQRLLWVNAICINQDDIPERNAQVSIMSTIFGRAEEVLVWVGEEYHDSRWLFKTISEYERISECGGSFWGELEKISLNTLWDMREALHRFFGRTYWRRVWIIQEVLSASRLSFYCGSEVLPWKAFQLAILPQGPETGEITRFPGADRHITVEFSIGSTGSKDRRGVSDLARLLSLCSLCGSECSDVRDHIYGLISVSEDIRPDDITIDYSKHPSRLYFDVMQACVFPIVTGSPYLQLKKPGVDINNFNNQVQSLLGNPLWDPISMSICVPSNAGCGAILEEFMARRLKVKLNKGLRISGVESIITVTGEMKFQDFRYKKSELLKCTLNEYQIEVIENMRQEFHRNAFLGLGHRKISKEVDEDGEKSYIAYAAEMDKASELWETPTNGSCQIIQLENGAFGLAPSHVQEGDRIFPCLELGDVYLVFRGWDEAQYDSPNFTLIGRATKLDNWLLIGRAMKSYAWGPYPIMSDAVAPVEGVDWDVDLTTLLLLIR